MDSSPMTPDLQASLLCDDVRQERNGKFMLIGLFETLVSPQEPFKFPKLCVVNRWCGGEGRFSQQTRILQPDQVTPLLTTRAADVVLPTVDHTATVVELMFNVTFPTFGTYWIEVLLNGDLKIRYPVRVVKVEAKPGPHTPGPHPAEPPPSP